MGYLFIDLFTHCLLSQFGFWRFEFMLYCLYRAVCFRIVFKLVFSVFVRVLGGLGLSDLGFGQDVGVEGGLEEKEWERRENGFRRE